MKKYLILLSFLLIITTSVKAEVKIGYVDMQRALNESEAGKRARNSLEKIIKNKQKLLDKKGKEIEKLKKEIQSQSSLLSEEALKQKQDELDRKMRDYKRAFQDAQEEVKKKEITLTNEILKEIRKIINQIGKEEKL